MQVLAQVRLRSDDGLCIGHRYAHGVYGTGQFMWTIRPALSMMMTMASIGCTSPISPTEGCPSSPPAASTSCPKLDLTCTWGSDPRVGCLTFARCSPTSAAAPAWVVKNYGCPPLQTSCPTTAPSSKPGGDLAPCVRAELGLTCVYSGSAYTCAACQGTLCPGPLAYRWYVTVLDPKCPSLVPNFGSQCESEGLVCDYNFCASDTVVPDNATWAFGVAVICQGGIWQLRTGFACP